MGEDTPDLPVYQWDGCFYLPVQWGLAAVERAVVEHRGHPFLRAIGGMPVGKASALDSSRNHFNTV